MSFQGPTPTMTPIIPENAPFSVEQRAWLNGFFAGFIAPQPGDAQPVDGVALAPEDDDAPWHDPSMPITDRMKLAEGKPLQRRMMAAMAQQDCGQCGYDCHNYSKAIVEGAEARLNLCVPGAKETLRMVKALSEEIGERAGGQGCLDGRGGRRAQGGGQAGLWPLGAGRRHLHLAPPPQQARLGEGDLSHRDRPAQGGIDYVVGDSFGLFPQNDPALVERVIAAIDAPRDFPIGDKTLLEALLADVALGSAPDALFELISYITGGERRQKARLLAKGEDPDGDVSTLDVLAAIEKFPGVRPDPEAFVECLDPLQPRLYSISSSHNAQPGFVTLTVDHVRYFVGDRARHGVASSWLAERLAPGSTIKAYVQRAHNFALPADTDVPIIMVGPGTGVAPFRAFLHDRAAADAKGGAWLFYGHQRRAADFFYEEEMDEFLAAACCRSCRSPGRATATRRPTCRTRCARTRESCGRGSIAGRTSTSAATPSAWRATSRKHWWRSPPSMAGTTRPQPRASSPA